ncbi:50S ribosomal protein L25 [uncultured Gammaproteobacteria bacterium]
MTETVAFTAEARQRAGKGTARQTRRAGRIPAVIYGNKLPPLMISLEVVAFERLIHRPGFFTHLFDITVDGATHRVLPRDIQFDPVSDRALHADFLRVAADATITVTVPVEFTNQDKCPGLKRGGTLNIVAHSLQVHCRADAIPEHLVIDVSTCDIGDSIHAAALVLPAGVSLVHTDLEATIVTLVAPSGMKAGDEEAGAEAAKS